MPCLRGTQENVQAYRLDSGYESNTGVKRTLVAS
jgi:hypothetical protein